MNVTRFERARLIGARALQISCGAPTFVSVEQELDPVEIATYEMVAGSIPLRVTRPEHGRD